MTAAACILCLILALLTTRQPRLDDVDVIDALFPPGQK